MAKKLSRRALYYRAAKERAAREQRNIVVAADLVERGANGKPLGLTEAGLAAVEALAKLGKAKMFIAASLGLGTEQFKKLFGPADNPGPVRLAYEKGMAIFDDVLNDIMLAHARTNPVGGIYYTKSRLGWRDNEVAGPAVENKIQISLPAPMSKEAFYATLGIKGPADSRQPGYIAGDPSTYRLEDGTPAMLPAPTSEMPPGTHKPAPLLPAPTMPVERPPAPRDESLLSAQQALHLKSLAGSESEIEEFWQVFHARRRGEWSATQDPAARDTSRREPVDKEARGIDPRADVSYSVGGPGPSRGFYR